MWWRDGNKEKSVKAYSSLAAYLGLLWLAQLTKRMIYQSNDSSVLVCCFLFKLPLSFFYSLILCSFSAYPTLLFLLLLKGKKEIRFQSLLHVSLNLEGNPCQKGIEIWLADNSCHLLQRWSHDCKMPVA